MRSGAKGPYTPAPCIQLGSFNSGSPEDEDELLAWYADYRLPAMGEMPSSIGMRKLASVSGWAKHGVMYEFTSLEDRAKNFRAHEAKDPKTAAVDRGSDREARARAGFAERRAAHLAAVENAG